MLNFLDFMVDKGYGTAGSIGPLKSAARQVLGRVEGEDFGDVDVRGIDVEAYLGRFENLSMGKYTADSLAAYRSRFRKAVEYYRSYLADPNWKPTKRQTAPARRNAQQSGKSEPGGGTAPPIRESRLTTPAVHQSASLIAYPFPAEFGAMRSCSSRRQLERDDADL